MAARRDRLPRDARRGGTRLALGLCGVVLCVLGALYYTGVLGTVYGHKSKVNTYAPRTATKGTSVWNLVRVDEFDNPTAYALTALDGTHLDVLLRNRDFAWTEGAGWVRDDTTVAILDAEGGVIDQTVVPDLDAGCAGTEYCFKITTKDYADVASAYEALVRQGMVASDLVAEGAGMVGTAYGPSMLDYRVYLAASEEGVTMCLFCEDAVAAGAYERMVR